jgi:hypothetical protein
LSYSLLFEWASSSICTTQGYDTISIGLNRMYHSIFDAKTDNALLNMNAETARAIHETQDQLRRLTLPAGVNSHFIDCLRLSSIKLEMDNTYPRRARMIEDQISTAVQRLDLDPDHKLWPEERNAMIEFLALSHEPQSLELYTADCLEQKLAKDADRFINRPTKKSAAAMNILARTKFQQYRSNPDNVFLLHECLNWLGRSSFDGDSFFNNTDLQLKLIEDSKTQPAVKHAYELLLDRELMIISQRPENISKQAAARGCIPALERVIRSYTPDFEYSKNHQSKLFPLYFVLWLELEIRQFKMTQKEHAEDLQCIARLRLPSYTNNEFATWAYLVLNSEEEGQPYLDEFKQLAAEYQTTPMSTLVAHRFAMEPKPDKFWESARALYTTGMKDTLDVDFSKGVTVTPAAAKEAKVAPVKSTPPTRVVSTILADLKTHNEQEKQRLGKENFQYTFGIFDNISRDALSRRRSLDNSCNQEPTPKRRHGRSQSF